MYMHIIHIHMYIHRYDAPREHGALPQILEALVPELGDVLGLWNVCTCIYVHVCMYICVYIHIYIYT